MAEKIMDNELPPLTDDEFKAIQEELRRREEEAEKNKPAPQGDYQWAGGTSFNGGFGEYQALKLKGKLIGGLFVEGSSWPGEYHRFSEDGGVYPEKSDPPVELRPIKR